MSSKIESLFACITVAFGLCNPIFSQVPASLSDSLQTIMDSFQGTKALPGVSASLYLDGYGTWNGVSGESHDGVQMDTTLLLGIGSNTKLFTSVLILKLAENSILSLDDSLHNWLPAFEHVDSNITIRQLLRHQSGINDFIDNNPDFPGTVIDNPDRVWTPEELVASIGPPEFMPGSSLSYSNTNYILAGMIIKSATGQEYHSLIRDSILIPLQLNHTYLEGYESIPEPIAHPWIQDLDIFSVRRTAIGTYSGSAGCITARPSDMAKWYHLLLNSAFLNSASLEELTDFVIWPNSDLFMGLGIIKFNTGFIEFWGHTGQTVGYASVFLYDPTCKSSVAVISNNAFADPEEVATALLTQACDLLLTTVSDVKKEEDAAFFEIYPNPTADGRFNLRISRPINAFSIKIVAMDGRTVFREENKTYTSVETISLTALSSGLYSVVIVSDNTLMTQKLIVN